MLRVATSCLLVTALAGAARAQFASYEANASGPVTSTASEALGVAWGDVDGDGDPDLLVVQGNGARPNLLYRNDGDGAFTSVSGDPLVTTSGNSSSGTFADVDGDGDLDAFVTNRLGQDNQLFRNLGGGQGGLEGSFEHVVAGSLVMDGGDSSAAAWFDLDGDGDLDLAVANRGGEANVLYVNQGGSQGGTHGVFVRQLTGPFPGDAGDSRDVLAGDLDGDGASDLVVVNAGTSFVYLGDGAGGLTRLLQGDAAAASAAGQAGALGDVDGDGDLDLVQANFFEPNAVYLNQGGGQGGTPGVLDAADGGYATLGQTPSLDVALADWDLDGVLDLAVANCCGADNQLMVGAGSGFFQLVPDSPVSQDGGYSTALAFADFDRDGAPDLVVANRDGGGGASTDFLYRNRAPGTFARRDGPADVQQPFGLAAGDVDGDGDLDLFVPNKPDLPNRLYRNQGGLQGGLQGEFAFDAGSALSVVSGNPFAAAFGDSDGDGDLDLALANRDGVDNALSVNQGGGQGGVPGEFLALAGDPAVSGGGSSRDVRWADVEGDGDLDLFFANSGDENDFLYLNQGGLQGGALGSFVLDAGSPVVGDGGKSYGADFGDVDGDGDVDLFVASRQGDPDRLYRNQGGLQGGPVGTFAADSSGPVVAPGGDSLAGTFGDPDNDGDLDLFVARVGRNAFHANQGGAQGGVEGTFVELTSGPVVAGSDSSRRGVFGDVDGDGDSDLFVPNVGARSELFRATPGGLQPMPTALPADLPGDARAALLLDLDGDADLDLLVGRFDAPLDLFENLDAPGLPPWSPVGLALAGAGGAPALTGTGSLRPNMPLTLSTKDAAPAALAYLFAGGVAVHAPLLGGTLVPSPDVIVPAMTNAGGYLALSATWPHAVPAGAVVYFQVFVTDPGGPFGYSATGGLRAITQ